MNKLFFALIALFSFNAFADEVYDFNVGSDTWRIEHVEINEVLMLKLYDDVSGSFILKIIEEYTCSALQCPMTAREFYRYFLDKSQVKLADHYSVTIPPETSFADMIEYLVKHGTRYNESDKTFSIIN